MKNLFITTVFALGSLTAFAQEPEAVEAQEAAAEVQDAATDAAVGGQEIVNGAIEAQDANTDAAVGGEEVVNEEIFQTDFSVIAVEELPEAVSTMIESNYPGATVDGAAKSEVGHYKVKVSLEGGTSGALILDEEGNAVEQ